MPREEKKKPSRNLVLMAARQARYLERQKQIDEQKKKEQELLASWDKNKHKYKRITKPSIHADELTRCFRDVSVLSRKPYGTDRKYVSVSEALSRVRIYEASYIRKPENFNVRLYNPERQFAMLVRHLFAKYPVPAFMDSVWYYTVQDWEKWFIDVAQGSNLRKCFGIPIPMTKKIAHETMKAPSNFNIEEALRYGQVMGLGGERRLVYAIFSTRIGRGFDDEEFRETVITWLIRNPMIDTAQISPLLDYIYFKRQNEPDYAMKGRGVIAMIRQMEEWHNKLRKDRGSSYHEWKGMYDILPWSYVEGKDTQKKNWEIFEITNSKDLHEEGRLMHHCVASYVGSCKADRCSIFSLRCNEERCLTFEVIRPQNNISQMRGLQNRMAYPHERRIVYMWAAQHNIIMSKYL